MEESTDVNYKLKFEEVSLELKEFVDSSRQIETEYERQLQELENILNRSQSENQKLKLQLDNLKKDHQLSSLSWNKQQLQLQQSLTFTKDLLANSKDQVRSLQNENDFLNIKLRESLSKEQKACENYNNTLEKSAILETVIAQKDAVICDLSRWKQIIMEEDPSFEKRHKI